MSYTAEEKAYHLRKMRTRSMRMDVNKDGFISREDFEQMGEKLAELITISKEDLDAAKAAFLDIADILQLKPGVRVPVEGISHDIHEVVLSSSVEKKRAMFRVLHEKMFRAIDTNKDGHISPEEFKVYFKIIAPDISDSEVVKSFNAMDTDKDGTISLEEFLEAAHEFMDSMKETELSNAFFGPLL